MVNVGGRVRKGWKMAEKSVEERVEAAWNDFAADMRLTYPAEEWPDSRLREMHQQLLDEAFKRSERGGVAESAGNTLDASSHYRDAGELHAKAQGIGVLLADRGDTVMQADANSVLEDLGRIVRGDGPQPRIVTTRDEDGAKRDGVLLDEDSEQTIKALWEQAKIYAEPHALNQNELAKFLSGTTLENERSKEMMTRWEEYERQYRAPEADRGNRDRDIDMEP
jgi:hypothetical protein